VPGRAEEFESRPSTRPQRQRPQSQGADGQRPQAERSAAGAAAHAHRTSFVLLLLGLLGGGMVCLLVVNTTLAANSIQIRNLQQQNANVSEQVQELQQHVAAARSAGAIEHEARKLGLRPDPHLVFINLHSKRIVAQPGNRAMSAGPAGHRAKSRHRAHVQTGTGKTGAGKTVPGKTGTGKTAQGGTGQ
jgi:hypothetical protein